ncbi:CxxC motif protein [Halorubrum phage Hardycor1]|nr:CxxC motif protein [Halorubrum phage Hardycor1]
MTTAPTEDEPTAESRVRADAERVISRTTRIEHGEIVDAWVDREDGEVVLTVREPLGTCPACGEESVGTTAWNGAQDRRFACGNDECGVDRFRDPNEGDA